MQVLAQRQCQPPRIGHRSCSSTEKTTSCSPTERTHSTHHRSHQFAFPASKKQHHHHSMLRSKYVPIWYGMVWYGMVWYGMVWYGMVWYGILATRRTKRVASVPTPRSGSTHTYMHWLVFDYPQVLCFLVWSCFCFFNMSCYIFYPIIL